MAAMTCPHCGEVNAQAGPFCEFCGKAMPSPQTGGPRVIEKDGMAQTSAGRELQSDELHKQTKKAATALIVVAVIQTIVAGLVLLAAMSGNEREVGDALIEQELDATGARILSFMLLGVAGIFWALWWWARRNPLPAAIVGLVIYGTLTFADAIFAPETILKGIVMKIIIIVMLISAIQAGVKHRQILRESAAAV